MCGTRRSLLRTTVLITLAWGCESELVRGADDPPHVGQKASEAWMNRRLKMDFLWCEPGRFTMGSPQDEPERSDDEDPVEVSLTQGFWLGKYEVTQDQWKAVMQTEPWVGKIRVQIAPSSPACWLSWDQAHLFCQELTRQERESGALPDDWEYILPTEAQWEYAGRAGTTTKYSFGDEDAQLFDYGWYGEQERQPQQMHARAVGQKKPNPWGFYDMHGNVVEWCRDWYRPQYPGGTDPLVSTDYNHRVTLRGGEWRLEKRWSRSACRQNLLPSGIAATIGFRVSLQQVGAAESVTGPTVKLAVVAFENRSRDLAYARIGTALSSLVAGRLSQLAALDVLERQSSQNLTSEATLSKTGLAQGSAADAQKEFAEYVLTGACEVSNQRVKVVARLSQPGFPQPVAEWMVQGSINDLFRLEDDLSKKVIAALKVSDTTRTLPAPLPGDSPILAILPFVNHSPTPRLDDLQLGFAELLQAGLSDVPGVRLVERGQIDKILSEQKLTAAGLVDPQTAIQVGKLSGAHRLLTGSFLELGDQISLQVRIISTRTGAVISSAKVRGESQHFADLTDDLTRRIIHQTEIALPDETKEAAGPTRFGRSLESSLHFAAADRFEREGKLPQAAEAFQQVLLLEPHSIMPHIHLIRVLSGMQNHEEIVKVGEHGLLYPQEFARCMQKYNLLLPLASAYYATGRYDALDQLHEKHSENCVPYHHSLTSLVAMARIRQKRFPDASRLMEDMAEKDVKEKGVMASDALRMLFRFYVEHSTSVVGIPIKDHQISARKAIELYDRVLNAAENGKPEELAAWAQVLIPAAVNLQTISDENQRVAVMTPAQKTDALRREQELFSRAPGIGLDQTYELAVRSENSGAWDDAVQAYQRFLDQSVDISDAPIEPVFGNNGWRLFDWIDKRLEAQYRIAMLQATQLKQEDQARKSYQDLVDNFGLAHFAGSDALVGMHQLQLTPEIPSRCALVWGGSTSNLVGWKKMLAAENLRMHAVRKDRLTLTDMAPYDLVIVNKSNNFPLVPSEILALRTYAASGGSVLIITSPAWHASAPLLQNSLLTFFDIQADEEPIAIAPSTEIRPHPITDGISSFTAHLAVGLRVPEKASLIKSDEKTILAALDFGQGRVVVAAVGGWYTPEILLVPEITQTIRKTVPETPLYEEILIKYRSSAPEPPLLRQTLRWLGEPRDDDPKVTSWRTEWRSVLKTAQETYACLLPAPSRLREWSALPKLFDRLVANAPTRELKEQSLWAAGECLLQDGYFLHYNAGDWSTYVPGQARSPRDEFAARESETILPRQHLRERDSGHVFDSFSLPTDPKFFERLIKDYPASPLKPLAQLRTASINQRRQIVNLKEPWNEEDLDDMRERLQPFQKLTAPKETYGYAWIQLTRGRLHFQHSDLEGALTIYEDLAETMPLSAEKIVAMINAVKCQILLRRNQDALRRISQLESLPDISWQGRYSSFLAYSQWAVHFVPAGIANTQHFTQEFRIALEKLDQNEEFQQWSAKRQKSQPRKPR